MPKKTYFCYDLWSDIGRFDKLNPMVIQMSLLKWDFEKLKDPKLCAIRDQKKGPPKKTRKRNAGPEKTSAGWKGVEKSGLGRRKKEEKKHCFFRRKWPVTTKRGKQLFLQVLLTVLDILGFRKGSWDWNTGCLMTGVVYIIGILLISWFMEQSPHNWVVFHPRKIPLTTVWGAFFFHCSHDWGWSSYLGQQNPWSWHEAWNPSTKSPGSSFQSWFFKPSTPCKGPSKRITPQITPLNSCTLPQN